MCVGDIEAARDYFKKAKEEFSQGYNVDFYLRYLCDEDLIDEVRTTKNSEREFIVESKEDEIEQDMQPVVDMPDKKIDMPLRKSAAN